MDKQHQDLSDLLHQSGYRLTPQRQVILEAVREANGHVTADEIVAIVKAKSSAINRATVYRTLKFLKELKLITTTTSPTGRQEYEIAGIVPHNHLVCRICGTDLEVMGEDFSCLETLLFERYGFQVDSNHITLRGFCINCRPIR
jgi:Fur family ferric uptake transcriptional regulator